MFQNKCTTLVEGNNNFVKHKNGGVNANMHNDDSAKNLVTGAFSGSFDRKSRLCLNDGQTRQTSAEMLGGIFFREDRDFFFGSDKKC